MEQLYMLKKQFIGSRTSLHDRFENEVKIRAAFRL